jgi:preprotein translocase subunit SecE
MGSAGMMPQTGQKASAGEFVRQVRQEANKVTWPTRKETLVTTAMVFAMSFLAAIFFFVVDWFVSHGVRLILGLGG